MAETPSANEDEYFLKQDADLVKELRAKRNAERVEEERKSHFMKCSKCGADLKEIKTNDVAVDVCSDCGGMWLDAGELDLLRKVKEHRFGSLFSEIFRSLPGK
ncbi:MAG: zf-TFIIB domain-containing protein [Gemmatimonadetes bacterium]|nr:zf-TFIIB domain-containing protein [Gemmatimonadota bacterium]